VTARDHSDLALLCEPVARIVWGKPTSETASELRWGMHGSRVVNREKGIWYDHEHGVGGGTLDLVPGATQNDRLQWLRDQGLIGDAPSEAPKRNGAGTPFTIIATYDYTDESGAPLFQVVRLAPKGFRQRRPNGKGGWTWSLGDTRRVLYRLPEVRDAVASGRLVFIVEGEKDTDNLRTLGFTATCNVGGANKWRAEYTESLRGADAVIIGDNDDSGRAHVAHIASSLQGVARRVRVLDLAKAWSACPAKGDISDWIEAGGTAEALTALTEPLPEWARVAGAAGGRDGSGASTATDDDAEIERLARLSTLEYEREREDAAERLSLRAQTLDKLVAAKRKELNHEDDKQGRPLSLPEPKPWPERVNGAELLCKLSAAIRQHVVMPDHSADATALWAVHTYLLDAFHITPRLGVTSPEKQCGKSTLFDVLERLVWRALSTENATTSAIFRTIERMRPTLLLDEGDTFLPENEELRGILNSGHRCSGSVIRTVGDDHEPRQFGTYAACAIAMIGKLPGTLADRSIMIELQRRLAGEPIEPFRLDRTEHLDLLASKAARWAADNADRVRAADPVTPSCVFNRVADNWRPLLAIAEVAGGEWPQRAHRALETIQATVEDDSVRVQLLADICEIFTQRAVDRLPSGELVDALVAIEGRPWGDWKAGKPLSQNGLARLLSPLKIRPGTMRIGGEKTAKGYYLFQFGDAFERYLGGGFNPSHRHKAHETGASQGFTSVTPEPHVTDVKCEKSNNDRYCDGVTDAGAGSARTANGNGAADHRCDHCGRLGASGHWDWPGWPDGIWLHQSCEEAWYESERDFDGFDHR
jgi:putative DNA primase/helicase